MASEPLSLARALAWRHRDWEPAARAALGEVSDRLRPGGHVLEIGYGSGLMACYLARRYGVRVTGYDIKEEARARATAAAADFGLAGQVAFHVCRPEDTTAIRGAYDVVFVRSVLATLEPARFRAWLRWINSVLVEGGAFVALENGPGSVPVRLCRRVHRTLSGGPRYRYLDGVRLREIDTTFRAVHVAASGRVAPVFSWSPRLHAALTRLEAALGPPAPTRSFVTAVVARR
ncbi:MAG TPA: methyltransferase domain-containing protein [Acidimicrobiales bacterium]|nr:methyltransferase domain-containing protein [Acidimicrobiales bacterium]